MIMNNCRDSLQVGELLSRAAARRRQVIGKKTRATHNGNISGAILRELEVCAVTPEEREGGILARSTIAEPR